MLGQEFIWLLSFYITQYYKFLQKSNYKLYSSKFQFHVIELSKLKRLKMAISVAKIADDLLEDADVIEKIYDIVKENPEKTREEIWDCLMNATMIKM